MTYTDLEWISLEENVEYAVANSPVLLYEIWEI